MPGVFEITFGGTTTLLTGSCHNYYALSNGELLDLRPWPAWCAGCQRFTEAEQFDSVERYDERIKIAERFAANPGLIPPEQPGLVLEVSQLPDLLRRRAWRMQRQSPPKCLECGSEAVTVLWGETGEFEVPSLGRVGLNVVGRCSSEGRSCHFWYFSAEGKRIR